MIKVKVEMFDASGKLEHAWELYGTSMESTFGSGRRHQMTVHGLVTKHLDYASPGLTTQPSPTLAPPGDGDPTCECGKEKHGFASHASWCKLGGGKA
jgi:hypothetical protein